MKHFGSNRRVEDLQSEFLERRESCGVCEEVCVDADGVADALPACCRRGPFYSLAAVQAQTQSGKGRDGREYERGLYWLSLCTNK